MNSVAKGFLIGCSVLLVLALIAVGGITWFMKTKGADLIEQGQAMRTEGTSYGANVAESQCVTQALDRYRRDKGITGGVRATVWLGGCLESSAVEPEFCSGVPLTDEFTRTVSWRLQRCEELGLKGDSTCPNIFSEVQRYCEGSVRKGKVSAAASAATP
jgi:hypothetical protein